MKQLKYPNRLLTTKDFDDMKAKAKDLEKLKRLVIQKLGNDQE